MTASIYRKLIVTQYQKAINHIRVLCDLGGMGGMGGSHMTLMTVRSYVRGSYLTPLENQLISSYGKVSVRFISDQYRPRDALAELTMV